MARKLTKKAAIEGLRYRLANQADWTIKGLVRIYSFQTPSEQTAQCTADANGEGFTAFDAEILSSLAQQWLEKQRLSVKQVQLLFKRMPKYASQLYRYAAANCDDEAVLRDKLIKLDA